MGVVTLSEIKGRLLGNIAEVGDCWIWQGAKNNHGYGLIKISNLEGVLGRNTCYVHRISYLCFNGSLEEDEFVCHRCDTPLCINPEHLFLGSPQDNMDDMVSKGRKVVNSDHNLGNNYAGRAVVAEGKVYRSYSEAGRDLGVSVNAIKKRIQRGVEGYEEFTEEFV